MTHPTGPGPPTTVEDDLFTLSDLINDIGAGNIPANELPDRPLPMTPAELEVEMAPLRAAMKARLQPLLDKVASNGPWCEHPEAQITVTVPEEHHAKLFRRQYPLAHSLLPLLKETILKLEQTGKVKKAPPGTKFNTPLLVAAKHSKDGRVSGVRVCFDGRQINKYMTEMDRFQLPHIPDVLERFRGNRLFGEFDLSEAYFQFRVAEESQQYLTFTVDGQQYQYTAAPFGLKHIPSIFQRFMAKLFEDMPFVFPYIDNLPFASKTWEEHEQHARMILERLNSVNMKLKASATDFGHSQLRILGHLIDANGIHMDPDKKRTVLEWPEPRSGAELAAFLGLTAFLQSHIRHYADITAPLIPLKKQDVIEWNDHLRRHLHMLRRAFMNAPYLKYPDLNRRFVIATDASLYGFGGVLYQPSDDEDTVTPHNIIAIASKKFNDTQSRYPVYKKELWAVIYCLRKWHTYIYLRPDTTIYTDHKPLIHILHQEQLSVALQQWLDVLLHYNLKIKYRPGVLHIVPDALSRMYLSAYDDNSVTWGTRSSIQLVESSFKSLSPSDILCEQSLSDAQPRTPAKRRHRASAEVNQLSWSVDSILHMERDYEYDDDDATLAEYTAEDEYDFESSQEEGALVSALWYSEYEHSHPSQFGDGGRVNVTTRSQRLLSTAPSASVDANDVELPTPAASTPTSTTTVTSTTTTTPATTTTTTSTSLPPRTSPLPLRLKRFTPPTTTTTVTTSTTASSESTATPPSSKDEQREPLTYEEVLALAQFKSGRRRPPEHLRAGIIQRSHDRGHFGTKAIYADISRDGWWWNGMHDDINNHVKQCSPCLRYNVVKTGFHPARSINAELPGDHWMVDVMAMTHPSASGSKDCLVVIDVFTGMIFLRELEDLDSTTIARVMNQLFSDFGQPKIVQSDNAKTFTALNLTTLYIKYGVEFRPITPYHSQADGKVERPIRTVRDTLNKMFEESREAWPLHLPFIQSVYNDKISELTGSSPFALMFGRERNQWIKYDNVQFGNKDRAKWREWQEQLISLIYPAIALRAKGYKERYIRQLNERRSALMMQELPPGTIVYVRDLSYIHPRSVRDKADPRYVGPFYVKSRSLHGPYSLVDSNGVPFPRRVPIDQLKVVKFAPGTFITDTSDVYEVQSIIDERTHRGKKQYLVKWRYYDDKYNSWVNASDVSATAKIAEYERRKKLNAHVDNDDEAEINLILLPTHRHDNDNKDDNDDENEC